MTTPNNTIRDRFADFVKSSLDNDNKLIKDYRDPQYVGELFIFVDLIKSKLLPDDEKTATTNCIDFTIKIQDEILHIPYNTNYLKTSHWRFLKADIDPLHRPFEFLIQLYLKAQYFPRSIINTDAELTALVRCQAFPPLFFKYIIEDLFKEEFEKLNVSIKPILECVIRGETQDNGIDWLVLRYLYDVMPDVPEIIKRIFLFTEVKSETLEGYKQQTGSNLAVAVFGQTKNNTDETEYRMLSTDTGHSLITDAMCLCSYKKLIGDYLSNFKFYFCFNHSSKSKMKFTCPILLKNNRYKNYEIQGKQIAPIPNEETYEDYMDYRKAKAAQLKAEAEAKAKKSTTKKSKVVDEDETKENLDKMLFITDFLKKKFKGIENETKAEFDKRTNKKMKWEEFSYNRNKDTFFDFVSVYDLEFKY